MGQARARGTYEERKAQAIAAGRIKAVVHRASTPRSSDAAPLTVAELIALAAGRGFRRRAQK